MPQVNIRINKNFKNQGFTLIELLVVISIVTIISVIGVVLFQKIRTNALTSKRLADLNAIKKAYEQNYDATLNGGQGGYKQLTGASFANGRVPTTDGQTPSSTNSYIVRGPDTTAIYNNAFSGDVTNGGPNYAACINTSDGSQCSGGSNCSCVKSDQGPIFTSSTGNGGSSCDPFGVLNNGLVGFWDIESTDTLSSIADLSGNNAVGSIASGTAGANGSLNTSTPTITNSSASLFAGTAVPGKSISITSTAANWTTNPPTGLTMAAWVKMTGQTTGYASPRILSKVGAYELVLLSGNTSSPKPQLFIGGTTIGNTTGSISNASGAGWYFIVATYNSSPAQENIYVYSPGNTTPTITPFSAAATLPTSSSNSIFIASSGGNNWYLLNGFVDKVRIYYRVLSAPEINILYNGGSGC